MSQNSLIDEEAPQLPIGDRGYVACRQCHTILTEVQFMRDGCYKCDEKPQTREGLNELSTTKFTGFVGLVAPEHSWVARLIGCSHMPSAVYAATLEDEDEDEGDDDAYDPDDAAPQDPEDAYDEVDDEAPEEDPLKKKADDLFAGL